MLAEMDLLIERLGSRPSRAAFAREARMEKLEKHGTELKEKEMKTSPLCKAYCRQ